MRNSKTLHISNNQKDINSTLDFRAITETGLDSRFFVLFIIYYIDVIMWAHKWLVFDNKKKYENDKSYPSVLMKCPDKQTLH